MSNFRAPVLKVFKGWRVYYSSGPVVAVENSLLSKTPVCFLGIFYTLPRYNITKLSQFTERPSHFICDPCVCRACDVFN